MPTALSRLKSRAKLAATARGHIMDGFSTGGGFVFVASCIHCGKQAFVTPHPAANEIDIAGEAVALSCQARPRSSLVLKIISRHPRFNGTGEITFRAHQVDSGDLDIVAVMTDLEHILNLEGTFRAHTSIVYISGDPDAQVT